MTLIASKDSKCKVFHYDYCNCISHIQDNNKMIFNSAEEARNSGYKQCIRCSKILQYYNADREKIDSYIRSHGLQMYIEDEAMYIHSMSLNGAWKITLNQDLCELILYHANTESYHRLQVSNTGHLIHHYHVQRYYRKKEILPMLEYIIEHDTWKIKKMHDYRNLPKTTKKQRKEYKKIKKHVRSIENRNVLNLIDKLAIDRKAKEQNKD